MISNFSWRPLAGRAKPILIRVGKADLARHSLLTELRMGSVALVDQLISGRSRTPLDRPLKSNFTIQIKSLKLTVVTGSAACCEDGLRRSASLLKFLGLRP